MNYAYKVIYIELYGSKYIVQSRNSNKSYKFLSTSFSQYNIVKEFKIFNSEDTEQIEKTIKQYKLKVLLLKG